MRYPHSVPCLETETPGSVPCELTTPCSSPILQYFINPQYRRHPPAVSDARWVSRSQNGFPTFRRLTPTLSYSTLSMLESHSSPINRDNIIRAKIARLKTLGREEGIAFRFSEDSNSTDAAQTDPKNRPNTVPAHRLLRLAFQIGGAEMQWQVLNKLYSAYFEHGMDVSDVGVLAVLATDVLGKDRDCLVSFLNSELLKSEVLEEEEQGRTVGLTFFGGHLGFFAVMLTRFISIHRPESRVSQAFSSTLYTTNAPSLISLSLEPKKFVGFANEVDQNCLRLF